VGAIAGDARDQTDDRPLIAGDDLLEGRLRAGERLDDEPGFAYRFEVNRDGQSPRWRLRSAAGGRCTAELL